MLSKIISVRAQAIVASLLAFVSCSGMNSSADDYLVGRRPEFFSTSYLWRAGDANTIAAVDRKGMTLQQFTLEPFAHVSSLPLPLSYEKQGVVASANGSYFVTVADSEYSILQANGNHIDNPLPLLGKISSVAFAPEQNYLVLTDEFQTMALLVLDAAGNPTAWWKGGSRIADDKVVRSGTMMDDGRLVLSLGTTTVAVVDVAGTVAAEAWQYTSFEVEGATDMKWFTSVPGQSDVVMVIDGERVLSLNVATGAILDQKSIGGATSLGYFRDFIPHVITQSTTSSERNVHDVTYIGTDGLLTQKEIIGTDRQISITMLAADETLTIVYDPETSWTSSYSDRYYKRHEIYRFRLTDNAGLDKASVDENVSLALLPDHLFLLYPSKLGKAARRGYGPNAEDQVVKGYNLDLVRKRHRN